jgi:hypothetical protein
MLQGLRRLEPSEASAHITKANLLLEATNLNGAPQTFALFDAYSLVQNSRSASTESNQHVCLLVVCKLHPV